MTPRRLFTTTSNLEFTNSAHSAAAGAAADFGKYAYFQATTSFQSCRDPGCLLQLQVRCYLISNWPDLQSSKEDYCALSPVSHFFL